MSRRRDYDDGEGGGEELAKKKARIKELEERLLSVAKMGMFSIAQQGHLRELQAMLNKMSAENGERAQLVNSVDDRGHTILHVAVIFKNGQMIRWILSDEGGRAAGFTNILAAIQYGGTALHFAVRDDDELFFAIVEGCKMENGERARLLNAVRSEGDTILHDAAFEGKIPLIQWILSDAGGRAAGFNSILAQSRTSGTALHAVIRTDGERAFFAIVEGSKVENGEREQLVNALNDSGQTVLHVAVEWGICPIIEWILSDEGGRAAGFNKVTARDHKGKTALQTDEIEGREEAFRTFIAGCKAEELTEIINAVDNNGWTLLHWASWHDESSIIEWLLSEEGLAAGFNKDLLFALTNRRVSVLHFAAQEDNIDLLRIILSSCPTAADRKRLVNGIDSDGFNVFHYCVMKGQDDHMAYFTDNYPEESKLLINRRDNDGMTPLHRAIVGSDEFEVDGEYKPFVVSSLLGYHDDEEAAVVDEVIDGRLQTTRTRRVAAAVGADPNLGVRRAEFN